MKIVRLDTKAKLIPYTSCYYAEVDYGHIIFLNPVCHLANMIMFYKLLQSVFVICSLILDREAGL